MKSTYWLVCSNISNKLFICLILLSIGFSNNLYSQNVAVTDDDGYTAASSAMLDVKSTTKGMLIPRLDSTQRVSISSPALGLLVFDITKNSFMYYNGSGWITIPQMSTTAVVGKALFAVTNAAGDTVFAVYNDGVKVTVDEGSKGTVGGFAVSGRTPTKTGGAEVQYFRVTPDSTRIYINDTAAVKGTVGGFAISGRTPTKLGEFDYLTVTPDSTRVYVNEGFTKGTVGGFAISGRTPTKTSLYNYFLSTADSTRIYLNDTSVTKGTVGGFAISGRTPTKGDPLKIMDITPENYLIGQEAGKSLTTGLYNSFMGYQAGRFNTEGSSNVFLGYQTGDSTTRGRDNVFMGTHAGASNKEGSGNVFLGSSSGYSATASNQSVYIGFESGLNSIATSGNVLVGAFTGHELGNGGSNTIVGCYAGYHGAGVANSIFGLSAGESCTGSYNCIFGVSSGVDNTGIQNSFYGNMSGLTNQGDNNTFIGYKSGYHNKTGSNNVFIGMQSGRGETSTGNSNVFIGYNAGYYFTSGSGNVFIGNGSGSHSSQWTSTLDWGSYNTFMGNFSGYNNVRGAYNIVLGNYTGYNMHYGSNNVLLGNCAGYSIYDGANNVFIGDSAGYSETGSNKLYIDNSPTTSPLIYGDFSGNSLDINGLLTITKNEGTLNLVGTDHCYLQFYPDGIAAGRKAYFGYPSGTSSDIVLVNGISGGNIGLYPGSGSSVNIAITGAALKVNGTEALWFDGSHFSWGYGGTYNFFADPVSIGEDATTTGYFLRIINSSSAKGIAYQWAAWSDSRVKKDQKEIQYGIKEIMKIYPKQYIHQNSEFKEGKLILSGGEKTIGLIAQELYEVIPEAVVKPIDESQELWSISYEKLTPVLIKSIQEQQKQIEELKAELESIKALLNSKE